MTDNRPLIDKMRTVVPHLKTWGEIKSMISAAGVRDNDPVFMIDLGPDLPELFVSRDSDGCVEIADDRSSLMCTSD